MFIVAIYTLWNLITGYKGTGCGIDWPWSQGPRRRNFIHAACLPSLYFSFKRCQDIFHLPHLSWVFPHYLQSNFWWKPGMITGIKRLP